MSPYHTNTAPPTLPAVFNGSEAAPIISEKRIIGYTTIFNIATSTEPNGEMNGRILSTVAFDENSHSAKPIAVPKTKPMRICAIRGIFFILYSYFF